MPRAPLRAVPTIDDLRVKLCYICREEEVWDKPTNPPTKWVHPCTCTLIAHEACLLEWIKTSEVSRDRTPANFLKCPQCGARYQLESKNPFVLRFMDFGSAALTVGSHTATVMTLGAVVASIGTGLYILLTGYGAFTVHQFVGDEMYKLLLPEDPAQWPMNAFLSLPLIPVTLLAGQTKRYRYFVPFLSLFLSWPSLPPVGETPIANSIRSLIPFLKPKQVGPEMYGSIQELERATIRDIFLSWPPSPFMVSTLIMATRSAYGLFLSWLRRRVLGPNAGSGDLGGHAPGADEDWQIELRLRDDDADEQAPQPPNAPVGQGPEGNIVDDAADREELRALARDDAQVVVQVDGVVEVNGVPVDNAPAEDAAGRFQAPAAPDAGVAPAREANQAGAPPRRNEDRNLMLLTGGVLGRLLGGALIIPTAASTMGSLLLRLALPSVPNAHKRLNSLPRPVGLSPRYLLQRFLAIRPPGSAFMKKFIYVNVNVDELSPFQVLRYGVAVLNRAMFVGSPAWVTADPVWWRNTVGLGLWFVMKDCFALAHVWLAKREILSRRVRDRSFAGINPKELDLKPSSRIRFE